MSANAVQIALASDVKSDSLTPVQRRTADMLKIGADFRQQVMLKHPVISEFHSYAEWLHAGLLESDPEVISYVPQPFLLHYKNVWYTPDVYVRHRSGPVKVIELKPRGEFNEAKREALEAYFYLKGMKFTVISNESVYEHTQRCENWLEIVRILHVARSIDTEINEGELYSRICLDSLSLSDVIDPGDRERTYHNEIALYRLLHRGLIEANMDDAPLGFDTQFRLRASS